MPKLSYNQNRVVAVILLALLLFSAVNDYFELAIFGLGKGFLAVVLLLSVVWGAFFAPTRQEMREHNNRGRGSPP